MRTVLLFVVIGFLLAASSRPTQAAIVCAGDCGSEGQVTIDDLLGMVAIALDAAPLSGCAAGDIDHDGQIRVDEILAAVHVALIGCPALDIDPATQGRCDPIGAPCMLPWPNDYFTVGDGGTATGRRLALVAESLPANTGGTHVDPTDQNRGDGWSPGSPVLVADRRARRGAVESPRAAGSPRFARCRLADRVARRHHRRAPSVLGGARRPRRRGRDAAADDPSQPQLP